MCTPLPDGAPPACAIDLHHSLWESCSFVCRSPLIDTCSVAGERVSGRKPARLGEPAGARQLAGRAERGTEKPKVKPRKPSAPQTWAHQLYGRGLAERVDADKSQIAPPSSTSQTTAPAPHRLPRPAHLPTWCAALRTDACARISPRSPCMPTSTRTVCSSGQARRDQVDRGSRRREEQLRHQEFRLRRRRRRRRRPRRCVAHALCAPAFAARDNADGLGNSRPIAALQDNRST